MSKYDPYFWEVSVDPQILESVLAEPDFFEQLLNQAENEESTQARERWKEEAVEQIRELIRTQLTPRQRQIVEMYFFQSKTQQAIAEELGINQQVVSKHLFGVLRDGRKVGGAMKKLRKCCENLGLRPERWV